MTFFIIIFCYFIQQIIKYTVHKLKSRRIKDAMFMSFKCSINFHRAQNVLIRSNFGHCTTVTTINVWERIGEKHLAQLVGEGACQHDIFTKYRLGCALSYGTCPISCVLCSPCYSRWYYGQKTHPNLYLVKISG